MSGPSDDFILAEGERRHPLWLRLKEHLEHRLAAKRVRNDDAQMDRDGTAALRGEIKCLKGLIALGDEKPPIDG